ncbi:GT2 family glycosyltransferase [Sphingomonas trueperi]|uniref:glycosyltransferase n=1 Tax=Sphingomonas trueperi TaxID=53317 RepID=UPI003397F287
MRSLIHWMFAHRHLRAARQAARNAAWSIAADHYAAFLKARPNAIAAWVQYGHVQKALGELTSARSAYERALALAPDVPDTLLHLAGVQRRLGERAKALDSCARAVAVDPGFAPAIAELLALGGRDRLPEGLSADLHAPDPTVDMNDQPSWLDEVIERQRGEVYAPARYDAYRKCLMIQPPPPEPRLVAPIHVLIDARGALPVDIRVTLSSLRDSADPGWKATVLADAQTCCHPVAGITAIDTRIAFVATPPQKIDHGHVLLARAGLVLERQAIGWFGFAAARTGCALAYADHDSCIDDWRTGRQYSMPSFQPMFDPDWFADPNTAPALLLIDAARLPVEIGGERRLLAAAAKLGAAHIPHLLASVREMAREARNALPDARTQSASSPAVATSSPVPQDRIHVVVQTRDQPALLRDAVASIRRQARRRDLLDITIVDNRSILPQTARLLRRYSTAGIARTLNLDEPFNWSRANNLAVAERSAPILVFLNNDTTMLTPGWDAVLHRLFDDPGVAAVGALLSYPDGTIQHAGMVFGMGAGGPVHEGVGHHADQAGPGGRWHRTRCAAAVTGAFLAVRSSAFDAVGGFDESHLAIAFNDVDLCLRLRALGHRIVQTGDIRLIHHESKSRGLNVTQGQVAWDLEELGVVHRRWGAALFEDPFYNPHWTRTGQPFDGYRFPSTREVVRHIDRSATPAPWAAKPAEPRRWW